MNRRTLVPLAALALMALSLTACSSSDTTSSGDSASEPASDAASPATDVPAEGVTAPAEASADTATSVLGDLPTVSADEWLTAITDAEGVFFDSAGDQALKVSIEVTDTTQGTATAETTYNPDDSFVATSTMTTPDGSASEMRVACTADACFRSADGGPWEEADRSLVERPGPGAVAAALQDLQSSGTVTHAMADGTFAVAVDIPEAEGQPAGTASLTETITDSEMVTAMVVKVGPESSTTKSTMTLGAPAALPDDLP